MEPLSQTARTSFMRTDRNTIQRTKPSTLPLRHLCLSFASRLPAEILPAAILTVAILTVKSPTASAQIVQIPSMGTFSISTSVAAPDSGARYAGGNRSRTASNAPGSIGQSSSLAGASVSATLIDLDELDRMIRSQAAKVSSEPQLKQFDPSAYSRIPAKGPGRATPPGYDYLAALSGDSADQPHVSGYGSTPHETDADATKYYLTLANLARQRGHWASVETYYRLAWQSLPQSRRDIALKSLEKSRAKASQERVLSKGMTSGSSSTPSK